MRRFRVKKKIVRSRARDVTPCLNPLLQAHLMIRHLRLEYPGEWVRAFFSISMRLY